MDPNRNLAKMSFKGLIFQEKFGNKIEKINIANYLRNRKD